MALDKIDTKTDIWYRAAIASWRQDGLKAAAHLYGATIKTEQNRYPASRSCHYFEISMQPGLRAELERQVVQIFEKIKKPCLDFSVTVARCGHVSTDVLLHVNFECVGRGDWTEAWYQYPVQKLARTTGPAEIYFKPRIGRVARWSLVSSADNFPGSFEGILNGDPEEYLHFARKLSVDDFDAMMRELRNAGAIEVSDEFIENVKLTVGVL